MTGSITRRGTRSWRIKFDLPDRDPLTGGRRTRFHTFRGTRKEAEAERIRLIGGVNGGSYTDPSKATVSEFFDRWDRDWATHNLSPKTIERHRQIIQTQLKPFIGAVLVQKLRPVHLSELYSALLQRGRWNGGRLSARTVGHVHRLVHRALGHAMQWGIITVNPAGSVKPPKVPATEIEVLNETQAGLVLRTLKGTPIYHIASFALASGCRRGEIAALRWRDIDFDKAVVRVERSLEVTEKGKRLRFKEPKTKHGRRNIALPSYVVAELRAHWRAQQEQRLALGMGGASPDDLVFCTPEGEPLNPDTITREWRLTTRAKNLPRVSFHALRHSHVSQLIASGMDVLTISRRIGHSSPTVTLNVYGHQFRNGDATAAAMIEAAFGAKNE